MRSPSYDVQQNLSPISVSKIVKMIKETKEAMIV